jgi:uncharacterized membrane protein YkoI
VSPARPPRRTPPATPAGPSAGQQPTRQDEGDPAYTGSITATDDGRVDGTGTGADEAAEAQVLQGRATISTDQARDAALAAVPGTADKASLDNENGFVVYRVEITGADGAATDVKADAGNGQRLAQDSGPDSESEQPDGTEQTEPAPAG